MSWAKLDDGLDDHPKFVGLPLEVVGLWTLCLTWAHRGGRVSGPRPGFLPRALPARYGGSEEQTMALETAGLWERCEDGWVIHDFPDYLPSESRPEVRERRSRAGQASAKARAKGTRAKRAANMKATGVEHVLNTYSTPGPVPEPVPEPVPVPVAASIVPIGTHPTPGEPGALVAAEGAAQKVFDAWKSAAGKNGATVLNKGRLAKVKGRLAEGYPLEDLLDAVVGITEHEWHRANGQVELELALRDGQHLERFRDIHRGLLPRRDAVTEGRIDREMRAALEGGTVDVDLLKFAYPRAYEEGTSAS